MEVRDVVHLHQKRLDAPDLYRIALAFIVECLRVQFGLRMRVRLDDLSPQFFLHQRTMLTFSERFEMVRTTIPS